MSRMIWISALFVTIAFVSSLFLAGCSSKGPSQYDGLAQCLAANGAVMYGTEWCPHCKTQKELFGTAFQYINYVDCDIDENACVAAGVKGYPTWAINGTNYPGTQSLFVLAKNAGCLDALGNATGAP